MGGDYRILIRARQETKKSPDNRELAGAEGMLTPPLRMERDSNPRCPYEHSSFQDCLSVP